MKYFILLSLILCPAIALCQDTVNPYNTQQPMTIELHHTDVYYTPYASPGDSDTRVNLCSQSAMLRDPNGVGDLYGNYLPIIYDTALRRYDSLKDFHLPGYPAMGRYVVWQRYFTAKRDSFGNPHDIIAGGGLRDTVTIKKNEDVDFRASGTIKMENGFHVMPGAFFHAYQEPQWGATVFKDDFDTSKLDESQWHIITGAGEGAECSNDSNVIMDTDYQATDGYVADVILREVPDTFSCQALLPDYWRKDSTCRDIRDSGLLYRKFSSATMVACPFPFNQADTPHVLVYQHVPYGKYEMREKLPHLIYHTNNWSDGGNEYDMNESWSPGEIHSGVTHSRLFGPCKGWFRKSGDTVFFISPGANWSSRWNTPNGIMIDNVGYEVGFFKGDTVVGMTSTAVQGGFPSGPVSTGDTVTFYYQRYSTFTADTVPWKVSTDGGGNWRIFSAPYHILAPGDSLRFTKKFQPLNISLTINSFDPPKTFACRWDSALNAHTGDTGYLYLYDPLGTTDFHNNTEAYQFAINDYQNGEQAPVQFDTLPAYGADSATYAQSLEHWAHSPYRYHTFTMEWLPNEVRFLLDSNVVRRIPDRLDPPGTPWFNWISQTQRLPENLNAAEFFIESPSDSRYPGNVAFFNQYDTTCSGCKDVTIGGTTYHAGHLKVDYVKVWDVPADVKIPNFSR